MHLINVSTNYDEIEFPQLRGIVSRLLLLKDEIKMAQDKVYNHLLEEIDGLNAAECVFYIFFSFCS